jgi:hypothetical protein
MLFLNLFPLCYQLHLSLASLSLLDVWDKRISFALICPVF